MGSLRDVRPQDAIKAFIKAGGIEKPGKGSHRNIKMPNGQIVTIPDHSKALKIGLLKAAIRKAGITEDAFKGFL